MTEAEGEDCRYCGARVPETSSECGGCSGCCTCVPCDNCGRCVGSVCNLCGRCDACDHVADCDRSDWVHEVDEVEVD